MMAAPTDYCQRVSSEPQEDCRDYLRTGRCKYGVSCKYYHPPNVQSGGGMKGPIDPSEPLFPIRPNEPACQYYLKHGTCKFGQACKFHHPPQSGVRPTAVGVMNVGTGRNGETHLAQTFLVNSLGAEHGGNASAMSLQFLPQRPDEPDCIYFLRNGRCKYGATCRYHHPVSVQQRKPVDPATGVGRRQHALHMPGSSKDVRRSPSDGRARSRSMSEMLATPVQFVPQPQSSTAFGHQGYRRNVGSPLTGPTHILVSDGPVSVVAMNGANDATLLEASHQHLSLGPPASSSSMRQEYSSVPSSPVVTSVASSYETAVSDMLSVPAGDSSSTSWNRPSRTPSGGSLNALAAESPNQIQTQYIPVHSGNRVALPTSASDTNIAGRYRSLSTAKYGSQYVDNAANYQTSPNPGWVASGQSSQPLAVEGSSIAFEQRGQSRGDRINKSATVPEAIAEHRHVQNPSSLSKAASGRSAGMKHPHRQSFESDDDGLTMMTSALLTMLDTPEEEGANGLSAGNIPVSTDQVSPATDDGRSTAKQPSVCYETTGSLPCAHQGMGTSGVESPRSPYHRGPSSVAPPYGVILSQQETVGEVEPSTEWSTSLQAAASAGRQLNRNLESMAALQPRHTTQSSSYAPTNSNLFLP